MLLRKQVSLYISVLLLAGCASIGPKQIHMDRGAYNSVVKQTEQEQLLLNIVRRRYNDAVQFIQIGSLTASYSLNEAISAEQSATVHPGPTNLSTNLSPNVNYSDSPTLTFIPLSNAEFAISMMTPITMFNLLLLSQAGGYDNLILMRLLFEYFNTLDGNLLNHAGLDYLTDNFIKFNEITDLIMRLSARDDFHVPRAAIYQKNLGFILQFKPHRENTPEARKLKKLLSIDPRSKEIYFFEHTIEQDLHKLNNILVLNNPKALARNVVYVRFRSLLDVMLVLSRGVQVPCKDMKRHMTRELIKPDGIPYDWTRRMKSLITIYSSNREPMNNVLVKVLYNKHWFYIKDDDPISKDTFAAVIRLFTLTSALANSSNTMPVLTIPLH